MLVRFDVRQFHKTIFTRRQIMVMASASAGTTNTTQWTRETIFEGVRRILVDALGVDEDEVGDMDNMEVRVGTDLGAESINFMDIEMRVEKRFGVSASKELFFDGIAKSHAAKHRDYVTKEGVLTKLGAQMLLTCTPWMRWDQDIVKTGAFFGDLVTVGYIIHYLEKKFGVVS